VNDQEEDLHSACVRAVGYLKELSDLHLLVDPPDRVVKDHEDLRVLRLRKARLHIHAATSWEITPGSLHLMGPDLRAASEQLRPVLLSARREDNPDGPAKEQRYIHSLDAPGELFGPLSHPTPMTLIQSVVRGGLDASDPPIWMGVLSTLLRSLASGYGLCVVVIARSLDAEPHLGFEDVARRMIADGLPEYLHDTFGMGI